MKLISVASEVTPFAKTGGLADVSGTLPQALSDQGMDVYIAMPYYRDIVEKALSEGNISLPLQTLTSYHFDWDGVDHELRLLYLEWENVKVIFIENDALFNRDNLYITSTSKNGVPEITGYSDNFKRFALFSRAVSRYITETGDFEIVHTHDWQTALIPVYLTSDLYSSEKSKRPFLLHTIHNLAFQGSFPMEEFTNCGLDDSYIHLDKLESWGEVNLLKGAVIYSDAVNTVSPNYCEEIQKEEYGCGFAGLLLEWSDKLSGILNGIDHKEWDPATDDYLGKYRFKKGDSKGKERFKAHFVKEMDFTSPAAPLFVMVSRLTHQKGVELLLEVMEDLLKMDISLFILGSGDVKYEKAMEGLATKYKGHFKFSKEFNNPLAHRLYAAADYFLMPSVFEPCGLGQMIAMRYGALPIARATGGLKDTVFDIRKDRKGGNGLVFESVSSEQLLETIKSAVELFRGKDFIRARKNAFNSDHSWAASANEYIKIYKEGLNK